MPAPRVLFISGSIGLGHVTRDLAIARELRALISEGRIKWLAGDMAREVVGGAGLVELPCFVRGVLRGRPRMQAAWRCRAS